MMRLGAQNGLAPGLLCLNAAEHCCLQLCQGLTLAGGSLHSVS